MSDDDDKPVFFTPSGKFAKGHPGFRGKQSQQTQPPPQQAQPDTPPFTGDFDDAIILIAESYAGKPRSFIGLLAIAEDWRRDRPNDFASRLSQAYINRDQKQQDNTTTPGIQQVIIQTAPRDMFIPGDQMRAVWEKEYGAKHKAATPSNDDEPSVIITPPPSQAASFDNDEDEQPYTMEEVKRMTEAQFDAAVAAGEIGFAGTKAQFDAAVAAGEIIIAGTDDE